MNFPNTPTLNQTYSYGGKTWKWNGDGWEIVVTNLLTGYAGANTITTLGTIATGVWNGSVIGVPFGGTGLSSYTPGNFLYASGTTTLGQRTPAQLLQDIGALAASAYTAADVLSKILTVDGAGSGLDADLLDGVQGANYTRADLTNLGKTGSFSFDSTTNTAAAWANLPVGYSAMFNSAIGTAGGAPVNNYGYFTKVANRDSSGGWGGLWVGYTTGQSYVGRSADNLTLPTWEKIWTDANDGAGSALDADLLDGQHGTYYSAAANLTGTALPAAIVSSSLTSVGTLTNLSVSNNTNVVNLNTTGGVIISRLGHVAVTGVRTLVKTPTIQINGGDDNENSAAMLGMLTTNMYVGATSKRGSEIYLAATRATAAQINSNTYSALGLGDQLGSIYFGGDDGVNLRGFGASIQATTAGTWTGTSHPGDITIYTTPINSVGAVERLRINSAGDVGIGTAGLNYTKLDVRGQIIGMVTGGNPSAPLSRNAAEFVVSANSLITLGENSAGDANPAITMYRTSAGNRTGTATRIYQPNSTGLLYFQVGSNGVNYGSETFTTTLGITSAGRIMIGSTTDDGANILQVTGATKLGGNVLGTGVTTFQNSNSDIFNVYALGDGYAGGTLLTVKADGTATSNNYLRLQTDTNGTPINFADFRYNGANGLNIASPGTVQVNGNTVWHAGNDGVASGLDADLLDGLDGASHARMVAFTADGGTGAENGANTWAKVASYSISGAFSDAMYFYTVASTATSQPTSAIISVFVRTNASATAPTLAVEILSMHGSVMLADDSFKLIANDNNNGFELWVRKANTYGGFTFYEIGKRLGIGVTVSYFSGAAWQSATPTGSIVNSSSAGIKYRGNTVWHAGNDGSGSTLDADLLDGQQGAYYLPAGSYNAADVLSKLLTVDGAGSALDADLLDGQQGAYYAPLNNPTFTGTVTLPTTIMSANGAASTDARFFPNFPGMFSPADINRWRSALSYEYWNGSGWVAWVGPVATALTDGSANTYVNVTDDKKLWRVTFDYATWAGAYVATLTLPYNFPVAGSTVMFEATKDNFASVMQTTGPTAIQGPYSSWYYIGNMADATKIRITFDTNLGVGTNINFEGIGIWTARPNAQGTTGERQNVPYSWDETRKIILWGADPTSTNTYDLGSSSKRWKTLYVQDLNVTTTITAAQGGTGIASYTTGNYINAASSTTLQQRTPAQVLSDIGALATSSYTAADVLSKLLTVDGSGTGLDADLLDGQQGSYYMPVEGGTPPSGSHILTLNGGQRLRFTGSGGYTYLQAGDPVTDDTGGKLRITGYAASTADEVRIDANSFNVNGNTVWHAGNDGAASGLDADLLDGQQGSYYLDLTNASGTLNVARLPAFTGDVTSPAGSSANTIAAGAVTLAKMANIATGSLIGRSTAGTGVPEIITVGSGLSLSGGTLTATGGGGSVTSVSVVTANGVSGSVATATTTPAITLTLGAITPTSVAASGTVTGSNLSGTNTGDQTTITGNAGSATVLQTARTINGVSFNGSANITVSATPADGTYGTIVVSTGGTYWELNSASLALGKIAQISTGSFLGNNLGYTNSPVELTTANVKTMLGLTGTNSGDQTITLTGHVTGSGTGSFATTIANGVITNAMQANMAANTLSGNNTGSPAAPMDLTVAQVKTLLAYTKSDIGLANVENTALSTWAGSTNITTVGAITATSVTAGSATVGSGTTTSDVVIAGAMYRERAGALTTAAVTLVNLDTWATATFRSAKYVIQVTDTVSGHVHMTELLVMRDNSNNVYLTEYASMVSGANLVTFTADYDGSANVRLRITPASTNSTQFKFTATIFNL